MCLWCGNWTDEYTTRVRQISDLDSRRQIGGLCQSFTVICFVKWITEMQYNDIASAAYLNNYSDSSNLQSLCTVYPQNWLDSHLFSYAHWLLGAALHCYYISSCILSWLYSVLICSGPKAKIMKFKDWQMDSCECPSVAPFIHRLDSCHTWHCRHATPLLLGGSISFILLCICLDWCSSILHSEAVCADTRGTRTGGVPMQWKGTTEGMLLSRQWTVSDHLCTTLPDFGHMLTSSQKLCWHCLFCCFFVCLFFSMLSHFSHFMSDLIWLKLNGYCTQSISLSHSFSPSFSFFFFFFPEKLEQSFQGSRWVVCCVIFS